MGGADERWLLYESCESGPIRKFGLCEIASSDRNQGMMSIKWLGLGNLDPPYTAPLVYHYLTGNNVSIEYPNNPLSVCYHDPAMSQCRH